MRSSADRASPWMSYTHIPLLGLLSLFDVTCSLTSFQKWSMSPIALHIAFIRMWYTFVVGLPGRTWVSLLAARNIKLVFTSKLWLDALDRREELLVSIVWLSSTQPLTGNQHGLHLCSSAIGPSTRMFEDSTSSSTQFISQDGITFLSVGSGDIYLPHMICYCNFPLD